MKCVATHSNYDILNKHGNMFNGVCNVSVKDFVKQMFELKKLGLENELRFATSDEVNTHHADAFLFVDMPEVNNSYLNKAISTGKPLFLLAWESEIINPRNSDTECHAQFRRVFTYNDSLVDNKKYIKVSYSFELPKQIPKTFREKKLCCVIAGNKSSNHPKELYSHRLEIIGWFEKNHPEEFDLYGQGWSKIVPPRNIWHRVVNKFAFINRFFKPKHVSYRGEVSDKSLTYQKYRFSICYENARDFPGYISEKIFDCFFAGCVPVYWGASNTSEHIPNDCYIDRRKFESSESLYAYLMQMNEEAYLHYLCNIERFLQSNKASLFGVDYFSKTIIENIRKDVDSSK